LIDRTIDCLINRTVFFAAIVNGDTADDVYARVTEVIRDHSELVVWVPVSQ